MSGNSLLFLSETNEIPEGNPTVQVPLGTIEFLETNFPNTLPMAPLSDWELGRLVGRQDIINLMRDMAGQRN
jgi:hypothetical protein